MSTMQLLYSNGATIKFMTTLRQSMTFESTIFFSKLIQAQERQKIVKEHFDVTTRILQYVSSIH